MGTRWLNSTGGCATPHGGTGRYDERWQVSEVVCRDECARMIGCLAYEFGQVGSFSLCELHREVIVKTFRGERGVTCHVKDSDQFRSKLWSLSGDQGRIELSGGNDNGAVNLAACTGECDSDAQCAAGLLCFQRADNEIIPGCKGPGGGPDWDYCYDPLPSTSPLPPQPLLPSASPVEWAPPGGVQGACRSAACDMPASHPTQCFGCYPGCNARNAHDCNGIQDACSLGAFEAFAGVDQARCQALCEADPTCRAYEWNVAGVSSGRPCELHYSDVSYTVHHGSPFRCYLKPSSGKRARSLLLGT